jgi:hypothetical protein
LEVSEVVLTECKFMGKIRSDAPLLFVCACVCLLLGVELKHAVCKLMGFMGLCDMKLCVCAAVCRSCIAARCIGMTTSPVCRLSVMT